MTLPTVCVVDDDELIRDSISELVSSVGLRALAFASAKEFLASYDPRLPGCLVLDVRMAHVSGLELQETLIAMGAAIPIVFISGHGDIPIAVKTIAAGAVDFVQKPYREQHLLDSINAALRRDASTRTAARSNSRFAESLQALTARERHVLDLLVKGQSSKAIAKALAISPRTVDVHRNNILQKAGVHRVPELIHLATRQPSPST
jgi:two-component system response regulator DctR